MPLRFARIAVPIFLLPAPAGARETRQLTAVRRGPGAIQVGGSLDDPGWAGVAFTAGFLQQRPMNGAAPSQPTEVAVAFDDTAVIVGVRLTQRPEMIRAGLTRRDTCKDLDAIAVSLDAHGRRSRPSSTRSAVLRRQPPGWPNGSNALNLLAQRR